MINIGTFPRALKNLRPESQFTFTSPIQWVEVLDQDENPTGEYTLSNFTWLDTSVSFPTKEEIEQEMQRLEALDAYQVPRSFEYPSMTELADAIYWQSKGDNTKMEAYLSAVEAVKQKYPKGV